MFIIASLQPPENHLFETFILVMYPLSVGKKSAVTDVSFFLLLEDLPHIALRDLRAQNAA